MLCNTSSPRILTATLLGTLAAGSAAHAAGIAAIQLDADRRILQADGKSSVVLSARVYTDRGGLAPNGTTVRFSTTSGRLDTTSATTQNGVARVTLTAAELPGEATITANLEGAGGATPGHLTITFTADSEAAYSGDDWVRISGSSYLGFVADYGIVHAIGKKGSGRGGRGGGGGAQIAYRGLEIAADTLQVNVRQNSVRALGNVVLKRGSVQRAYSTLRYDLTQGTGLAERDADGRPDTFSIQGLLLEETRLVRTPRPEETPPPPEAGNAAEAAPPAAPEAAAAPAAPAPASPDNGAVAAPAAPAAPPVPLPTTETFALEDIAGASVTVKARAILLEPNVQLQFRRADFYLEGEKKFSLPLHRMSLNQESLFSDQVLGYGPNGITFDLPLYYDVRPSAIGTVHVRHGARVGASAYSTRPGLALDVEHNYNGGGASDGRIELTGFTRKDWGARWSHSQRLDADTRGQLYVDLPNRSGLYGNALVSRKFPGFTVNANASASRASLVDALTGAPSASGGLRAQLYAQTDVRSLPGAEKLQYTFSLSTARQGYFGSNAPAAYNIQSADVRLSTPSLSLDRRTTLTPLLSLGQTWTSGGSFGGERSGSFGGRSGASILGSLSLRRTLGQLGSAGLVYDYSQTPQFSAASGRHRLGGNLFMASGSRWNLMLNGSQSLDKQVSTLYGDMGFSLGGPWRGRVVLSSSRFSNFRYNDVEYALIRRIAGRDVAVYYSTSSRRLHLDLAGARF